MKRGYTRWELSKPASVDTLAGMSKLAAQPDRHCPPTSALVYYRAGEPVLLSVGIDALRDPAAPLIERIHVIVEPPAGCDCGKCEEGPNMLVIRCAGTAARQTEAVAG